MFKEEFNIVFNCSGRMYVGKVFVFSAPGFYYFAFFISGRQILLFVDDEQDQWIENGEGNTHLARIVGNAIDQHYHPNAFLGNPPIDPE